MPPRPKYSRGCFACRRMKVKVQSSPPYPLSLLCRESHLRYCVLSSVMSRNRSASDV